MRLIYEDGRDDVDEDTKLDFGRKDFSEIGVNQMQKRALKFEAMGNKKDATEDVGVDIITGGLESCKIRENKSDGLTEMLTSLTIEDKKPNKNTSAAQEPQEVDELTECKVAEDASSKADAPEKKEEKKSDKLVKLEAPSFDENEESDEKDPEGSDGLGSRGPSYGIPVNHDPENSYLPNNYNGLQMPANFPVYTNGYGGSAPAGHMKKRSIDNQDACNPSYKYVCPQMTSENVAYGQLQCGDYHQETAINSYNDLSGQKKQVTNVYLKQMSGGTVVETDEQDCQAQKPGGDLADLNIPISPGYVEDLLGELQNQPALGMAFTGEHYYRSPGQTLTHNKRVGFGFDDGASEGYYSDASPAGEIQISPTPSPHSVMEAPSSSPPMQSWSPLSDSSFDSGVSSPLSDDQMRSPRPYHKSAQQTGAHSQRVHHTNLNRSSPHPMMSPPHQMMASPRHMVAPPQHIISSPQQVMSPDHIAMSSQQPVTMQGQLSMMSTSHHMSSPHYMTSQQQVAQSYQNIQAHKTSVPCSDGEDTITHPFIDLNLENLNIALIVASEDLKEQAKKGYSKLLGPTKENIPKIAELNPAARQTYRISEGQTVSPNNNFVQQNQFENVNTSKILAPTSFPSPAVNRTTSGNKVMQPTYNCQVSYPESRPATVFPTKMLPVVPVTAQGTANPPPGKVAIPQMRKTPSTAVSNMPTSASANMSGIPVFIVAPQLPKPRFTPIAPKEPTNPAEVTTAVCSNIPQTVICDSARPAHEKDVPKQGQSGPVEKTKKDKLLNIARRLVAEMSKPDLKFKDEDGDTYLHVAVCKADCFMVQALLERMVREGLMEMIDMQNCMGQTPIYLAVSTNHPEMVQLLIDHKADANPFAEFHLPTGAREKSAAIHCASQRGDKYLDTLKALLKAPHINLNQVNSDGHTALHCAILAHGRVDTDGQHLNSIPIIHALISAGADPNLQTQQSGKTALMYALESRDLELIEKTLHQVDPSKLASYLKTQAFDGSTCYKIAELLKQNLHPADQQRLSNCLKVNLLSR
ncbi:unnamed protein product [Lymnaea stagnalis]|uniref:NF-kappa-B inhibitor zeta n=1 Tax=Lymnaea stagnalis TaxID=6523 RepID=A0AAV2IN71_LYMST